MNYVNGKLHFKLDIFVLFALYLVGCTSLGFAQNKPQGKNLIDQKKVAYLQTKGDFSKITKTSNSL